MTKRAGRASLSSLPLWFVGLPRRTHRRTLLSTSSDCAPHDEERRCCRRARCDTGQCWSESPTSAHGSTASLDTAMTTLRPRTRAPLCHETLRQQRNVVRRRATPGFRRGRGTARAARVPGPVGTILDVVSCPPPNEPESADARERRGASPRHHRPEPLARLATIGALHRQHGVVHREHGHYITVPFQVKELTGSLVAVGLLGAAELVPLVLFGLYGGALADVVDRRRMVLLSEAGLCLLSALLLVNALLPNPQVWPLYVGVALIAALDGLQRPSLEALVPRLLAPQQLPAAAALSSLRGNVGMIAGPAIGGLVATTFGVAAAYALDVVTFAASLAALFLMRAVPPLVDGLRPSLRGIGQGRDTRGATRIARHVCRRSFAMFFAMPPRCSPSWPTISAHLGARPALLRGIGVIARCDADQWMASHVHVTAAGSSMPPRRGCSIALAGLTTMWCGRWCSSPCSAAAW